MADRHRRSDRSDILFFIVYYGLNSIHTLAITGSLREVVLLLNFCYFFSLYFVPLRLHLSIVFIDKIVKEHSFWLRLCSFYLPLSDFFECWRCVGNFLIGLLRCYACSIFFVACYCACNIENVSSERV